ncbi:MAG: NAD(P)H-dependent oxidoreductase subunit E, partial [Candidatus Margulisiibacteriota bacterium]
MKNYQYAVSICAGSSCKSENKAILARLTEELTKEHLLDQVRINECGCVGFCSEGPVMVIHPDDVTYCRVSVEDVPQIVQEHLREGRRVTRLIHHHENQVANTFFPYFGDVQFFAKQYRITLRHCGIIDPESLEDYLAFRGYEALAKVLTDYSPSQVIDIIKASGLRGRGGGGFPTGVKWQLTYDVESDEKYVICNADEGDPGAFMDRSAIEGDPHTILEGMAIGGYAVGSKKGIVYFRAEYPLAIKRLELAIEQARAQNLLGDN